MPSSSLSPRLASGVIRIGSKAAKRGFFLSRQSVFDRAHSIYNEYMSVLNGKLSLRIRFFLLAFFLICGLFVSTTTVEAFGGLTFVSDTISTSVPSGTTTAHTILFTPTLAIPASGKIVITPQAYGGTFTVPALLDFTDIDLATAPILAGPYTERTLAASPSATDDGISVVSGTSGAITITLGSGGASGIASGLVVRIKIGSVAIVGAVGDQHITSPGALGSHHIRLVAKDAADVQIQFGSTLVVMVAPVNLGRVDTSDAVPPVRSNGLPSGLLPGSTQNVFLSLNTNKIATCRYATTTGIAFSSMLSSTVFTTANLETLHFQSIPVTTGTAYNIYVRCQKFTNPPNPDDYLIAFQIGVPPGTTTPPAPPPPPPTPSGPSGTGGGGPAGGPFIGTGEVTIEGMAAPGSTLVILKDGVIEREVVVSVLGNFSEKFTNLLRGTYAWGAYMRDPNKRNSSTYTSTIYLIARTNNMITPVYLSPTIGVPASTIPLGGKIVLSGYAIALTPVQVLMNKQGNALTGSIISATTTANGNGFWSLELPSDNLTKGTYEIKAVSVFANGRERSLISPIIFLGLGEDPNPDFGNRSDLNKDRKVNLVDFSILLFNWQGTDAIADINQDGKVNLTDFSIMLANWTG